MPQAFEICRVPSLWKAVSAVAVLFAGLTVSPAAGLPRSSGEKHASESTRADSYVLTTADNTMSTNLSIDEFNRIREKRTGDFLWFRRDGKASVIDDRATLEEARSFFAPLSALEPEQEDLRRRQEALEEKEQELDREEEVLDRQVDRMDQGDGEDADTEDAAPASDAEQEEFRAELDELRSQQEELQSRHRELEASNRELEAVERSLDSREDAIEKEAEAKLWSLIDAAVKKGLATRPPEADSRR